MTKTFLSLVAAAVLLVACSGTDAPADPPCTPKQAPLTAPVTRLALSRVDFGNKDTWRSIGFDLDGACTTTQTHRTCKPGPGGGGSYLEDGQDGIDNSWGRNVVGLMRIFYADPNAAWSGRSVLDVGSAGTGTLYLLAPDDLLFEVPLVDVRMEWNGTSGTLAAIVPVDKGMENLRRDLSAYSKKDCGSLGSLAGIFASNADVSASGVVDDGVECTGVSLGMTFEGTPTDNVPQLGPSLCEDAADAGP